MHPGMRELYCFAIKGLRERLRELWHGGFLNEKRGTEVNALTKVGIAALLLLDYCTRLCLCYYEIENANSASSSRELAMVIMFKMISNRR
jgi:hypothetical protein